jgi:amidase
MTSPAPSGPELPEGLMAAFHAYESALMNDDVAELDRLFAPGPATMRGDANGLLVGHDTISSFRSGRGGAPQRTLVDVRVQVVDPEHELVVAITELARGGRGQQTQLWARTADGWKVTAAHVAVPAPALDTRIWRVVGDPLLPASGTGPLTGETLAVKDLYAVSGQRRGAGNPAWLAAAPVETTDAAAVSALRGAGAAVKGLAQTDEFAYSLAGTNAHSGTPPNPKAPHRISGGSTSGSASAVSLGHASIGLGTDTGGSIRIPAAYQGLFGIRTTHGLVSVRGLLPLAPSFDTVGWLTRTPELLARVGDVLLPESPGGEDTIVTVPALTALADADVASAVAAWLPEGRKVESWDLADLEAWTEAFRIVQAHEAWATHGVWLTGQLDTLGDDVRGRFEAASTITHDEAEAARDVVATAQQQIQTLVGDHVLALPAAPTVAPQIGADLQPVRAATLKLTCLAGLGGLPAVTVPLKTADGLPCGVCLVAAPGRDRDLLTMATAFATTQGVTR